MITISYDYLRDEELMLVKAFDEMGVRVNMMPSTRLMDIKDYEGVYLVRNMSHRNAITISGVVEASGAVSINSYDTLSKTWNKAISLAILRSRGVPIPRSRIVFSDSVSIDNLGDSGLSIIKPVSGSWGRLVALAGQNDARLILKHAQQHMPLLIQERFGDGKDIRVFVIDGQVAASMVRIPEAGEWRSNVARGGLAKGVAIDSEVSEIAIKAAEALGAFYAGVDILVNNGDYAVSEVNGIPEFKALTRVTGINIAFKLAEAVLKLAKS